MMIHDQWLVCSVLGGSRVGCWLDDFLVVALAAVDLQQEHVSITLLPPYVDIPDYLAHLRADPWPDITQPRADQAPQLK